MKVVFLATIRDAAGNVDWQRTELPIVESQNEPQVYYWIEAMSWALQLARWPCVLEELRVDGVIREDDENAKKD